MNRPRRNLGVDLIGATAVPQSDGNMASYQPEADRRTQSDHVIEYAQVALIDPAPQQTRRAFDHQELVALAESIGRDGSGLLQPPTVRRMANGRYQLVAGERRLRAAKLNDLTTIRVQIRDMTEEEAEEAGCRENIDRSTLLPWETCMAYLAMRELARKRVRTNAGAGVVAEMSGQRQRSVVAKSRFHNVERVMRRDSAWHPWLRMSSGRGSRRSCPGIARIGKAAGRGRTTAPS